MLQFAGSFLNRNLWRTFPQIAAPAVCVSGISTMGQEHLRKLSIHFGWPTEAADRWGMMDLGWNATQNFNIDTPPS
jgi:hypothetical protein